MTTYGVGQDPVEPTEPEPAGPFVRRDVGVVGSDTETWDPIVLAYVQAVRTMQARPGIGHDGGGAVARRAGR